MGDFDPADVGRMVPLCPECMQTDGHLLSCSIGATEHRIEHQRARVTGVTPDVHAVLSSAPLAVFPVPPGSIICLPESMFETAEEGDDALDQRHREIMGSLAERVGHNQFTVIVVGSEDAGIATLGREEVKGLLRELLQEIDFETEKVAPAAAGLPDLTRVGVSVPLNKTVEAFVPCGATERHEPHVWDETEDSCKACTGVATVLADAG